MTDRDEVRDGPSFTPRLHYVRLKDGSIIVDDTREAATEHEHVLGPDEAGTLRYLERPQSTVSISRRRAAEHVQVLSFRRIAVELDGYYFSVVTDVSRQQGKALRR